MASAPLHNGPRMIREIEALNPYYDIFTIGATPPHDSNLPFLSVQKFQNSFIERVITKVYKVIRGTHYPRLLFHKKKKIFKYLSQIQPDYVIAHDPSHLPYLLRYPEKQYKVIYNAHEYHPLEFDEDEGWLKVWGQYYYRLYKESLPQIDLLINVCQSIANKCEEEFNKSSIVIPNAAIYYPNLHPVKINRPIRIIHHGISNRTRRIEVMIEVAQKLGPAYQLDLMLVSVDDVYYQELVVLAQKSGNVQLIKPVSFEEIVPYINQYDIGLYNLPPESFNNKIALPNKFFEFIQARLCLVVSPSVEMKNIVEEYNLGVVSKDFTAESICHTIQSLTMEDIARYKSNSDKFAFQLSAEQYQSRLIQALQLQTN